MPSLDFIYDITEKLDEEKLSYLVLTIREGRREDKVDVFFRVDKDSEEIFNISLDRIKEIINTYYLVYIKKMVGVHSCEYCEKH